MNPLLFKSIWLPTRRREMSFPLRVVVVNCDGLYRDEAKGGGSRVIYFLQLVQGQIILVTMYAKNVQASIDPGLLRKIRESFKHGKDI